MKNCGESHVSGPMIHGSRSLKVRSSNQLSYRPGRRFVDVRPLRVQRMYNRRAAGKVYHGPVRRVHGLLAGVA
jgi:hypothetical protein